MSTFVLSPEQTLAGYDQWSRSYDHEDNPLIAATTWVLDRSPLGCADAAVVELGCGTGRNIPRILSEGARSYLGLDGSPGMLERATASIRDPRVTFAQMDLLAPWSTPEPVDFALMVLVLEHLTALDVVAQSLARSVRPGGRLRIVDLHPERVAAGALAHFHDGGTEVRFASVAHPVTALADALDSAGFDVVRRDWLATDTLIAAVPGVAKHRGTKLVLDIKATRRLRERRPSGTY